MKKTSLEQFREELLRTGAYATPAERRARKRARPSGLTTLRFTWGVTQVFPKCAVAEPLGRLTPDLWAHFCFSSVQVAERLGMNVIVEGFRQREAHHGPVMYLCNHLSSVETILLPPILLTYGPLCYVAKASLSRLPFLGAAARHTGMIPIGRQSPREDLVNMLRIGTARIKDGESCLIFPQGTRAPVFSRRQYSSIGAKLAEKAGCPIVPIVVDTRCQPTRTTGAFRKVFKDFGPVDTACDIRCACGPVIPCTRAKEMHEAAFDWMADKLASWGMPVARE